MKIVIGVSGGCDSMCLLHQLQSKYDVVVAHVNYGLRAQAKLETAIVEKYCEKYQIPIEILYVETKLEGNFQDRARTVRYQFYQAVADQYQCNCIATAHHQDDVLETFLMQKQRGSIPQQYGIAAYSKWGKYEIVRPLLSYTKQEIIDYCVEHAVPFMHDESNFELKYTRNKIRQQLSLYQQQDKKQLLEEIKLLNLKKDPYHLLRKKLFAKGIFHCSDKTLENITVFLTKGKGVFKVNETFVIYPDGEIIESKKEEYCYYFEEVKHFICDHFTLSPKQTIGGFYVAEDEFPICIRNFKPKDKIKLPFGHKSIARFFVDKKIPISQRKSWPIVLNCRNEIIFVPKLGSKNKCLNDNCNVFVVK